MAKTKVKRNKQQKTQEKSQRKTNKSIKRNTVNSVQTPINQYTVTFTDTLISTTEVSKLSLSYSHDKKRKFGGKQIKNWKPVKKATQDYIKESLNTGVGFIISKAVNEGHQIDDIQELLANTVQIINEDLKTLKAPFGSYGDLKKISQIQKTASDNLRTVSDREENLEQMVDEEERSVQHYQRELDRLDAICDDDTEIHPLFQTFEPELDIPSAR